MRAQDSRSAVLQAVGVANNALVGLMASSVVVVERVQVAELSQGALTLHIRVALILTALRHYLGVLFLLVHVVAVAGVGKYLGRLQHLVLRHNEGSRRGSLYSDWTALLRLLNTPHSFAPDFVALFGSWARQRTILSFRSLSDPALHLKLGDLRWDLASVTRVNAMNQVVQESLLIFGVAGRPSHRFLCPLRTLDNGGGFRARLLVDYSALDLVLLVNILPIRRLVRIYKFLLRLVLKRDFVLALPLKRLRILLVVDTRRLSLFVDGVLAGRCGRAVVLNLSSLFAHRRSRSVCVGVPIVLEVASFLAHNLRLVIHITLGIHAVDKLLGLLVVHSQQRVIVVALTERDRAIEEAVIVLLLGFNLCRRWLMSGVDRVHRPLRRHSLVSGDI